MTTHELKTWTPPFQAILEGRKTYEIRSCEDRAFAVGDHLHLREWVPFHDGPCAFRGTEPCAHCGRKQDEPMPGHYSGREILVEVTYMTPPGKWGLPANLCVLGIYPTEKKASREILTCVDCKKDYIEMVPGGAFAAGWDAYHEVNDEGTKSPRIVLCPACTEKPFKLRHFKKKTAR